VIIDSSGGEWVIKLGPVERTNCEGSREQAEEGAARQLLEDAKEIMEKARTLLPLLVKGAVCPGECEPEVKEESPEPLVVSYHLPDGKWFSIATAKAFGFKLVCRKEA
jgi:hypothetical protein